MRATGRSSMATSCFSCRESTLPLTLTAADSQASVYIADVMRSLANELDSSADEEADK